MIYHYHLVEQRRLCTFPFCSHLYAKYKSNAAFESSKLAIPMNLGYYSKVSWNCYTYNSSYIETDGNVQFAHSYHSVKNTVTYVRDNQNEQVNDRLANYSSECVAMAFPCFSYLTLSGGRSSPYDTAFLEYVTCSETTSIQTVHPCCGHA